MTRFDPSLVGRRWQIPIVLPAVLAGALVSLLAVQSVRAVQAHRTAVDTALHDYAAFATWQYARRASDYLRLTLVTALPSTPRRGSVSCTVGASGVSITRNETDIPARELAAALAQAASAAGRSHMRIGLVPLGAPAAHHLLSYWFGQDATGEWSRCDAMPVADSELVAILAHVAGYAPLLPPSVAGPQRRDTLVSIRVLTADGAQVASMGGSFAGITATDTLGPDLAGLRVVATLHPAVASRLVGAGLPGWNAPVLGAMLVVTLVLCAVAVLQLERSRQIVRLRGDFVASVSHELRTPLAQISLFADTLAAPRERGADERLRYLTIISRESRRLGQLVDSILHFAGMARGGRAAVREPAVLGDEIREAIAAFQPIAQGRSVRIRQSLGVESELPLDRDGFRQLMLNLLDNALKFGPDGQTIVVSSTAENGVARIRVDDAGPGVPAADRERIFEPFARMDRASGRAGSGIGLAVVADVVQAHGGRVYVLESPSGGARVEIELPGASALAYDRTPEPALG